MNQHLTEQQILECVAGTATPESLRHIEECAGCAAEVQRLDSGVRGFAAAVQQAAKRPAPRLDWQAASQSQSWWTAAPAWRPAFAALALILISSALLFYSSPDYKSVDQTAYTTAQSRQQQLERERTDAALLEQVDAAVSRPVPQPIEPLVQLVAWESKTNSGVTE